MNNINNSQKTMNRFEELFDSSPPEGGLIDGIAAALKPLKLLEEYCLELEGERILLDAPKFIDKFQGIVTSIVHQVIRDCEYVFQLHAKTSHMEVVHE